MKSHAFIVLVGLVSLVSSLGGQGAPACPRPQIDTTGWFTVAADSPMVEFRLAAGFVRKYYEISFGKLPPRQEWRRGPFLTFVIEESAGPATLSRATPPRRPPAEDYSECSESFHGARGMIQAQRGDGTIFKNEEESKPFDVYVTIERRPGMYVRIRGMASSRTDQELLLAIVRTVRLR